MKILEKIGVAEEEKSHYVGRYHRSMTLMGAEWNPFQNL